MNDMNGFHPTTEDRETIAAAATTTTIRTIGIVLNAATIISPSAMNATAVKRLVQRAGGDKEADPAGVNGPGGVNDPGDETITETTTGIAVNAATQTLLSDKNATCAVLLDQVDGHRPEDAKMITIVATAEVQTAEVTIEAVATTARSITTTGIVENVATQISRSDRNATAVKHLVPVAVAVGVKVVDRTTEDAVEVAGDRNDTRKVVTTEDGVAAVTDRNEAHKVDTTEAEVAAVTDRNDAHKVDMTVAEVAAVTGLKDVRKVGMTEGVGEIEAVQEVPNEVHTMEVGHDETTIEKVDDLGEPGAENRVNVTIHFAKHAESDPVMLTTAHQEISENHVHSNDKTTIEERRDP